MGYTPGPWEIEDCSNGGKVVKRGGPGKVLQSHIQVIPDDDAYLIAAAPELLEACKQALLRLNDLGNGSVRTKQILQAAINKAEGKKEA